jgi:hypothetical protein
MSWARRRKIQRAIAMTAALLALGVSYFWPNMGTPDGSLREKCQSNLMRIGQAILLYTNDNHGQYPDTFERLLANEDYITSADFVCPETNDTPAQGATTQAVADGLNGGGHLSYIFVGSGLSAATATANTVVAYEPLSNHKAGKAGMNVLFGDRHVEFIEAGRAKAIIAKTAAGVFPVTIPSQ